MHIVMINNISVLYFVYIIFYSLHVLLPTTFAITIGFRYLVGRGEYHNTTTGGVGGVRETEQSKFDSLNNDNIVIVRIS